MLGPYKSILYILCVTYYILIFILFLWLVRPSDIKLTRAPYRCLASHKKLIFCHWRLIYNFRFWLFVCSCNCPPEFIHFLFCFAFISQQLVYKSITRFRYSGKVDAYFHNSYIFLWLISYNMLSGSIIHL